MNLERILQHKGVIVWALRIGAKKLESVKKGEQDAELPTVAADHRLAVIEELLGELDMQGGPGLEGTPMGDMVAGQVYRAEDGTPLDVGSLDEMLRRVGVDAPPGAMGGWTLEERREVYAWVKSETEAILNSVPFDDRASYPDVIEEGWVRRDMIAEVLERPLEEEDIDAALEQGPWGVGSPDPMNPASDEWAIRKTDPADPALFIEHAQRFGQLDRARLVAANLNLIELGRRRDEALADPSILRSDVETFGADEPEPAATE